MSTTTHHPDFAAFRPLDPELSPRHTISTPPLEGSSTTTSAGRPGPRPAAAQWLMTLPRQLAGNDIRRVRDHLCRAKQEGRTVAVALGGHVIKTGCAPYLIEWINDGLVCAIAMNGSAAIHDFELAIAGKTSENVAVQLPKGEFGMVRETADAFAVAARLGADSLSSVSAGRLGQASRRSRSPSTPTTAWSWRRTGWASRAPSTSPSERISCTCIRMSRERPSARRR